MKFKMIFQRNIKSINFDEWCSGSTQVVRHRRVGSNPTSSQLKYRFGVTGNTTGSDPVVSGSNPEAGANLHKNFLNAICGSWVRVPPLY